MSVKFSFKRCMIYLCYYKCSQMNGGERRGRGCPASPSSCILQKCVLECSEQTMALMIKYSFPLFTLISPGLETLAVIKDQLSDKICYNLSFPKI